jgi:hypothetical protein
MRSLIVSLRSEVLEFNSISLFPDFRDQMKTLYDRVIHDWRENTVTCALAEYRENFRTSSVPFSTGRSHSSPYALYLIPEKISRLQDHRAY